MSGPVATYPDSPGKWQRKLALAAWLLFVFAAVFGHVRAPEDFGDYVGAGEVVLAGGDIYNFAPNTWPPFFSLVCVPLALLYRLSSYFAVALWSLLNCAVLFLLSKWIARLAYHKSLTLIPRAEGLTLADPEIFVPVLLTLPYLIDNFQFHQINLILFAVVLCGLFWQQDGHPIRGGIVIGVAAAIKVMPVLFVPYLVWRRRWRAATAAIVATVLFSVSPILVFGWMRFWSYAASWLHVIQVSWDVSGPNQSVFAMWDRILGHSLMPYLAPGALPLATSGQSQVLVAWALTFLAIGLASLFAFRGRQCASLLCWVLEWSVIFLIAAIFGRITWKHYLVVMLLPNALLYALWRSRETSAQVRRVCGTVLSTCFVLALVTGGGLVGRRLALRFETGSVATDAVLIMLCGLFWLRHHLAREHASSAIVSASPLPAPAKNVTLL